MYISDLITVIGYLHTADFNTTVRRMILGRMHALKVRNSEIRKQTHVKDIILKIKEAKWRWAGHLMRKDDNRWTKRMTEWQPRCGQRGRGRQKLRWRDDITSYAGTTWTRLAQDRKQWKNHEEGYIQQWMNTAWWEVRGEILKPPRNYFCQVYIKLPIAKYLKNM